MVLVQKFDRQHDGVGIGFLTLQPLTFECGVVESGLFFEIGLRQESVHGVNIARWCFFATSRLVSTAHVFIVGSTLIAWRLSHGWPGRARLEVAKP